jgi:hypothetical protein
MGGGSSSGGGSQTSTTETIVPDWVQAQIQQNITMANQVSSQPYTPYPGPELAGFTPDQLASFQAIESLQGQAPGQIQSAYNSVADLPATIATLQNPYTSGAENTVVSNALRSLAIADQSTQASAVQQGALGGTRDAIALAANASQTQAGIGQSVNNIAANQWLAATQAALQGGGLQAGLASQDLMSELQGAGALNAVGSTEQTFQQAGYSDALQQWQAQQNYPYQQLAMLQSALAGSAYGNTVQSSQPYNSNPLASAIGMAASAIPAIANIPGAVKAIGSAGTWLGGLFGAGDAAGTAGAAATLGEEGLTAWGATDAAAAGAGAAATGAAAAGAGKSAADAAPLVLAAA